MPSPHITRMVTAKASRWAFHLDLSRFGEAFEEAVLDAAALSWLFGSWLSLFAISAPPRQAARGTRH